MVWSLILSSFSSLNLLSVHSLFIKFKYNTNLGRCFTAFDDTGIVLLHLFKSEPAVAGILPFAPDERQQQLIDAIIHMLIYDVSGEHFPRQTVPRLRIIACLVLFQQLYNGVGDAFVYLVGVHDLEVLTMTKSSFFIRCFTSGFLAISNSRSDDFFAFALLNMNDSIFKMQKN